MSPPVSLIISPSRTQHFSGDSLSLSCEGQSDSTGWRVRGYTHSGSVSDCSSDWGSVTGSKCTIGYLYTYHTGVYWCQSESGGSSNPVNITVHNLPTTTLTVASQSPVFTGESVTLKCEVQGYDRWTYQWYKKKAQSQWTTVSQSVFYTVNRDTLTISGDAVVNGDQYQCRGERHDRPTTSQYSNTVTLTVHAGDSSSLGLVGLAVGLSLVVFFILLTLLWCYENNKESLCRCTGSQSDINQTSDQTQRESGDTGAGPSEVTYAEIKLKPKQKAKKKEEGYAEYEERRERSDITLELDRWSDQDEDPSMEVEEVPQGDPSSQTDITGSKGDEPPATKASPKALPRA
ncbi:hypothetical protein P4O66_003969, partial [Electrophorus voltai]